MKIKVYSRGETVIDADPAWQEYPIRQAIEDGEHDVRWVIVEHTDNERSDISHDDYAIVTEDDGTELWRGWLSGDPEEAPPVEVPAPLLTTQEDARLLLAERDGMRNALQAIRMGIAQPSPRQVAENALNGRYFDPMLDSGVWHMDAQPAPDDAHGKFVAEVTGALMEALGHDGDTEPEPGETPEARAIRIASYLKDRVDELYSMISEQEPQPAPAVQVVTGSTSAPGAQLHHMTSAVPEAKPQPVPGLRASLQNLAGDLNAEADDNDCSCEAKIARDASRRISDLLDKTSTPQD